MIKHRLIFHFYAFWNWRENRAIQIHLECLKAFAHVFDEAIFVISVDVVTDKDLIREIEFELIKCGFENVRFIVRQNNNYCEAETFYNDIIKKLDVLDGLTFFGHTKGITNYSVFKEDSIDNWIIGMYYLSLNFMDEVDTEMIHKARNLYGSFLTKMEDCHYHYSGTFYWLNCQSLWNDYKLGRVKFPEGCFNRNYAELFPVSLYWGEGSAFLEGKMAHERKYLYFNKVNLYENADIALEFLLGEDITHYKEFKKKILDNIEKKP